MRHNPRLSPNVLCLLLALVVASILVVDAARSKAAPPDGQLSPGASGRGAQGADAAARARHDYGLLPLSFEPNRGQADARVQFLARNGSYSLYLTADGMTLALRDAKGREGGQSRGGAAGASVLRIKLLGASGEPRARGLDELGGKSNYLVGRDPSRWRTNVPNYGKVRYEGVYPGVDVVYYGTQRQLEYDFDVAPGADAGLIRLRVEGARDVRIDANGDLVLPTPAGEVRQQAPHAYQEVEGERRTVACRYVLLGDDRVGFELGDYDRARALVIDPVVRYSTLLGGSGSDDSNSIAIDAEGNAYVTGFAESWDFPVTPDGLQQTKGGAPHRMNSDAFVAKLNPEGTGLVYSTYLGGAGGDAATGIAVDGEGRAHVAGMTDSYNFPTTAGAFRTSSAGSEDVFVSQLSADGSALLYSTYLGGSNYEGDAQVALGGDGGVYVSGQTASSNYPITPGVFQPEPGGLMPNPADGFVTKLVPAAGAGLTYSTFLGGSSYDFVEGVAVGADGSAYLSGRTVSADFPVTANALQPALAGDGTTYDAFVTRLNPAGTAAVFSTYFGGESHDYGSAIALDPGGVAYITGPTFSGSLPTTPGAFQPAAGGPAGVPFVGDGFVAKLSADGGGLVYSTYFGGSNNDEPKAIAVDSKGDAYVVGTSNSPDLPVTPDALQAAPNSGNADGFLFRLNASGGAATYATYLGGHNEELVRDVAVGAVGDVYLTGLTGSVDFPTTPYAFQPYDADGPTGDGFVMKFQFEPPTYKVSGRVTVFGGAGMAGANVRVEGDYNAEVSTDADGYYSVEGIPAGAYLNLWASRHGYTFVPVLATIPSLQKDEEIYFTGDAPLVVQGRVANEAGTGLYVPVTITSDDGSVNVTNYTLNEGRYYFVVPPRGNYTVTPGPDAEYTFAPASKTFDDLRSDQTFDFLGQRPPRIFGRVAEGDYGYGLGGVRVTLTGPALAEPLVQTTDNWGYFFFENLERGATYTLTPADAETNRSFEPASLSVENIQGWEFVSFTALPPLNIHGHVKDANNNGVGGGVATLTGTVNAQVEIDQWGYFSFMNLPRGGDYTVKVTRPDPLYTFDPPSRSVTNMQQMQFFEFEALPPLVIRGQVATPDYKGVPAAVTLSGTVNATTQADEWGFFSFENLPRGGDYTVTVSYPLYTFTPPTRAVTNIQSDQFFPFEALPPLRILGGVTAENGSGVAGATVTLTGTVNRTTTTDEYGGFAFPDLPRGGNYTVTPAHELYNFTPPSREFPSMNADQVAGFNGVLRRFTLRGRASDAGGAPLAGVYVHVSIVANGVEPLAMRQTDENGNYSFDLAVGRNYFVTAARPGYSFAPAEVNINDPRGDQTADFNGKRLLYMLGGRVTDSAGGAGLAGATVTLSGPRSATAQTDAQGYYVFTGLPSEGDYTVGVSHPHFGFEPAARSFDDLLADATADFSGTRVNRQIRGRVTDGSGAALAGATVTLGGAGSSTVQTDSFGDYLFNNLPSGLDYTVTVAKTHYAFGPATRQFDGLGADATADFNGTLLRHKITGRVVDAGGNGFAGALVNLVGRGGVTTDATGNFAFEDLPAGGNYTVTASREFYDFSPSVGIFNDLDGDAAQTFTATLRTFSVGGRVADGWNGVAGLTVTLSGTRTATTQTDAQGNYLFASLPANGNYTVAPAASAVYAFSPAGKSFNTLPYNETANFAAARHFYQVGGLVRDACGRPLPGVTVSLARAGSTLTAQTDSAGSYTFVNVPAGYDYTLAPTGSAYAFTPASFSFPGLSAHQTAGNFTGTPPAATADAFALADLYVRGGNNAGSYFGTSSQLIARLSSQAKDTYESYLKFNVGQPCSVSSVRLRLYGQLSAGGSLPVAVYGVPSTTWTETGTNWNNKPAAGAPLRTVNVPGTTAAWYEWDVTDYVRSELAAGRSTVAFALKSTTVTNYQVTFNSRQATGANAPRLVITTP